MKKLILLNIIFTLCITASFSQLSAIDSISTITVLPDNSVFNILEIMANLPSWFYNFLFVAVATLTATQTILTRFPTEKSIKIKGLIGKFLDVLAFFPKDNKKGGGTF